MNTTHTPGPWHIQSAGIDGNTGYYKFVVDSPTHEIVADRISVLDRTYPELEANARLIAASPELLAAVKMVLDSYDAPHRCSKTTAVMACREAITKAIGGAS